MQTNDGAAKAARLSGQALVDHLGVTIRGQIMEGVIPPGTWLRQETLASEFGVSRTPVREALRQLQASGVLEVLPRRGALVRGPTPREIREAYFVRSELEGSAAELAAERITDEQLSRLAGAETLFREAVEDFTSVEPGGAGQIGKGSWAAANDLFHDVILEACGNRCLRDTVYHLYLSFPRNLTWVALASSSRLLRANADEHMEIRQCIEQRNGDTAREAMRRHVRAAGELVAHRTELAQDVAGSPG